MRFAFTVIAFSLPLAKPNSQLPFICSFKRCISLWMGSFTLLWTDGNHGGFSDSALSRSSTPYQLILSDMPYICPISLPLILHLSLNKHFLFFFQGTELRSHPTNYPTSTLPLSPIVHVVYMTLNSFTEQISGTHHKLRNSSTVQSIKMWMKK